MVLGRNKQKGFTAARGTLPTQSPLRGWHRALRAMDARIQCLLSHLLPSAPASGSSLRPPRIRLFDEELERRVVPAWSPVGPLPHSDWVFPDSLFAENVSGRVAFSPNFDGAGHPALFIGTAGGGI
jgi:hypothetical protein